MEIALLILEKNSKMAQEVHGFQTEVTKLLGLLAKSLYSNKEVFLRELVSNASDAVDKLRFLSLTKPELTADDPIFSIRIKADPEAGTLSVIDNGIGMTLAEANDHLGTIAKSGPPIVLHQPMKECSPKLLPLLEKVAINNNVIISVFDYSFLSQFFSFYHNSIIPLGITNFIAFALDKRSYSV